MSFLAFIALLCLLAAPLLAVALSESLYRFARVQTWAVFPPLIAAGLAFVAAWVLHFTPFETIVGGWSPVSVTAAPLVLGSFTPNAAILIAWTGASLIRQWRQGPAEMPNAGPGLFQALMLSGLTLVAFADSLTVLLIGLGLVDGFTFLSVILAKRRTRLAALQLLLHGLSLIVLIGCVALHATEGNSLYFPLARFASYLVPFLDVALFLRCGAFPLSSPADKATLNQWQASACATLMLAAHLPGLGAGFRDTWFVTLAVISLFSASALALLSPDSRSGTALISVAAFAAGMVGFIVQQPSTIAAAAVAWLFGSELLQSRGNSQDFLSTRVALYLRILGAAVLIGIPLTVGFVSWAGIPSQLTERGFGGIVLLLIWVASMAMLTAAALRIAFLNSAALHMSFDGPSRYLNAYVAPVPALSPMLLLALIAVLFGVVPQLVGAAGLAQPVLRNGILDWVGWLVAIGVGGAAWWFESRWQALADALRGPADSLLNLRWLHELWGGAVQRLARPLRMVFPFLESDGVLLWAIILILLFVLVNRPGGP